MSRLLATLRAFIVRIFGTLAWLLASMFGKLRWMPPPWLIRVARGIKDGFRKAWVRLGVWRRQRPARFYGAVALCLTFIVGADYGWRWWRARPKPVEFSVTVTAPEATPLVDDAKPNPVHITFGGSAAPLELIGKKVSDGITIEPPIKGTFTFVTDSRLTFTPEEEWEVGQTYRINLSEKLFPTHVLLETYSAPFATATLELRITSSEFYTDLKDPKIKRVLATIKATHPLNAESVKAHLHLVKRVMKKGEWVDTEEPIKFQLTFDKFMGEAYVVSDSLPVPVDEYQAVVTLDKGVTAAKGGPGFGQNLEQTIKVPGMYDYFRILTASPGVARNDQWETEQILVIETSAPALQADLLKNLAVFELPKNKPASAGSSEVLDYSWSDAAEIGPDLLNQRVKLTPVPTAKEYDTLHTFKYRGTIGRYLFVRVEKGIKSYGDYVLAKTFEATARVPELPQEVAIMHEGSILSLTGDKRLSVMTRDVPGVKFTVGRVLPSEVHHLASQTSGAFARPSFNGWTFNESNIAELYEEVRPFEPVEIGKARFTAFDFARFEDGDGDRRGLFFLTVQGFDPETKTTVGPEDKRFILITDLGVVVKRGTDGVQDVFVASFRDGKPVPLARVDVVGKNGLSVFSAATDQSGHVTVPSLEGFTNERSPVTYLITRGQDLAMLPIERSDRFLNLSRFDIGGETSGPSDGALQAYLFTDRGIYRPGDTFHVGIVVKDTHWTANLAGMPLEIEVTDPRGLVVGRLPLTLTAFGFDTIEHATLDTAPTGDYQVTAYLVREDGKRKDALGFTRARVEEFFPDRMRIASRFSTARPEGWVPPDTLTATVTLANLFGTPAVDRRVKGAINLMPWAPAFSAHREYQFFDPKRAKTSFGESLTDAKTTAAGEAVFDLDLKRFADATYRLSFTAEGFEAEGGRAVTTQSTILVSPNPWLIGVKPDGNMRYIKKGSKRDVHVIAIDPELTKIDVGELKAQFVEQRYVSVLTKQASGVYKYESVRKELTVDTQPLAISKAGAPVALRTNAPGTFALVIRDSGDRELNRLEYSVAGEANLTRSLERDAELEIKLAKSDYSAGEAIEIQIIAPYTGAGLITIEKDRVYAHKWFTTTTSSTTQSIEVPNNLEGNGYVSISFVRDPGSKEIYTSPLSYGVAPFSVSRARRTNPVTLGVPDLVEPGTPLSIQFEAEKPGKIVIFAVDEGILQVARYQTPDPLGTFFRKRALEVRTAQIFDLLLPDYDIVASLSAPGGDGEGALGANLNPFRRKSKPPVAFWSGLLDVGPQPQTIVYNVPDYFNGTLRVMAVAVAAEAVGVAKAQTIVRGPFVLNPNVPTFVTPGDEFLVSLSVANNVKGSGDNAEIKVDLKTSSNLKVLDDPTRRLTIPEGREASATFNVKAQDALGAGTFTFTASRDAQHASYSEELSVRPVVPFYTRVQTGTFQDQKREVDVTRSMFGEFRTLEATISTVPLGLSRGLSHFLERFPYGCTEQLVSKAIPALILGRRPEFQWDADKVKEQLDRIFAILRTRQNGEGAFGYWAANASGSDLHSAYATHFLIEARERGEPVPVDMLTRATRYLSETVKDQPGSLTEARAKAYALYVLTRAGIVTTAGLEQLSTVVTEKFNDAWRTDVTAIHMAATYQLLQQTQAARKLIAAVTFGTSQAADYNAFYDGLSRDAQLLYVRAKHFPDLANDISADDLNALVAPIAKGTYNTMTAAQTILALDAYAHATVTKTIGGVRITEILSDQSARDLSLTSGLVRVGNFSPEAKTLRFSSDEVGALFYQTTEAGFDLSAPTQPIKDKLEIQREYRDAGGKVVTSTRLGDKLTVHLKVRAIEGNSYDHIAIVDLLPAGLEIDLARHEEARQSSQIATTLPSRTVSESADEGEESDGEEGEGEGGEGEGGEGEYGSEPAEEGPAPLSPQARLDAGGSTFDAEYADIREDRVVLFGSVRGEATEFVYKVRSTTRGLFKVPPIYAESMYDRSVQALSLGGTLTIEDAAP